MNISEIEAWSLLLASFCNEEILGFFGGYRKDGYKKFGSSKHLGMLMDHAFPLLWHNATPDKRIFNAITVPSSALQFLQDLAKRIITLDEDKKTAAVESAFLWHAIEKFLGVGLVVASRFSTKTSTREEWIEKTLKTRSLFGYDATSTGDAHVHLGALPMPELLWLAHVNGYSDLRGIDGVQRALICEGVIRRWRLVQKIKGRSSESQYVSDSITSPLVAIPGGVNEQVSPSIVSLPRHGLTASSIPRSFSDSCPDCYHRETNCTVPSVACLHFGERLLLAETIHRLAKGKSQSDEFAVDFWRYIELRSRFVYSCSTGGYVGLGGFNHHYSRWANLSIDKRRGSHGYTKQIEMLHWWVDSLGLKRVDMRYNYSSNNLTGLVRFIAHIEDAANDNPSLAGVRWILAASRTRHVESASSQREASEAFAARIDKVGSSFTAVDFVGRERGFHPSYWMSSINKAREIDLGVTIHLGEDFFDYSDGLRSLYETLSGSTLKRGDRVEPCHTSSGGTGGLVRCKRTTIGSAMEPIVDIRLVKYHYNESK